MKPFKIYTPYNKEDFIRGQKIRWEIHWRRNRKQLINYSIASVIILTLGIILITDEEPMNPFIFIGIGFTPITLLLSYFRFFSKRQFYKKTKEIAEKFDEIKMDCTYEFSDETIKYWDKEKTLEFKWTVFTNYSIYKNYLILILNNSLIESYLFEKTETDINDYNKIFEITKSKLEYKKIR